MDTEQVTLCINHIALLHIITKYNTRSQSQHSSVVQHNTTSNFMLPNMGLTDYNKLKVINLQTYLQ
jgi:hypothetical protein